MDRIAKKNLLNEFELFQSLNEREIEQLVNHMEVCRKGRYASIYEQGDASTHIYLLNKGTVKIGIHNGEGKEVIKRLIHPKAVFGELGLVGETTRTESAYALKEEVELYTIKVEEFRRIMMSNVEVCHRVLQLFGQRLIKAETRLENLIFKDARSRIITFLHSVVEERGRPVGLERLLKHSMTHQDIANITCTSRQTVTLVLNELRKDNLIYFNRGRILVRDMDQLAACA
ncbi:MAG: Crp/Fnr family transcriptional regulator [Bacteroidota bacterium]